MSKQVLLEIQFELSEEERVERAKEASRLCRELDKLDAEFKENRAAWRTKIKGVKDLRDEKNLAFELGNEPRKLMCDELIDWDNGKAHYWFERKIVRSRDLDPTEQRPLFDNEDDDVPVTEIEREMANEDAVKKPSKIKGQKLNKNGFPIIEQAPVSGVVQ